MHVGMFFIALEIIIVIICAVFTVKWMFAEKDEYDKMLDEIADNSKGENN